MSDSTLPPSNQSAPSSDPANSDMVSMRTLIVSIFATIIISMLFLEKAGMINHNLDKEDIPLSQYQVVYLKPGEDFRMSHKAANQTAYCRDGYVMIASDDDPALKGILIDYKNRGVRCSEGN
ncbi:MAG: kinase [Hahellaceae bacterium]|nr:kinase [Hahellaceae bacterium]